jgi:hypothetical protein
VSRLSDSELENLIHDLDDPYYENILRLCDEVKERRQAEREAREGLVATHYTLENGTPWVYVTYAGEGVFGMAVDDTRIAEERRQAHAVLMACDEAERLKGDGSGE